MNQIIGRISGRFNHVECVLCRRKWTLSPSSNSWKVPRYSSHQPRKNHISKDILNGDAADAFFFTPSFDGSVSQSPVREQKEPEETFREDSVRKDEDPVVNPFGIQLLSKSLHEQVFKTDESFSRISPETFGKVVQHLKAHDLWGRSPIIVPQVDFKLPPLMGCDLNEHFELMARKQSDGYKQKLLTLIEHEVPEMPKVWNFAPGWTRYEENGDITPVDFPEEDAYVFDVEVCVKEGHAPTLATAVSNNHWYSWCSNQLIDQKVRKTLLKGLHPQYSLADLIPLETRAGQDRLPLKEQKECVVVGHNVSYDRTRVKEQYFYEGTKLRFVDTMSMHIAVSGITSYQRMILQAEKNGTSLDKSKSAAANGNKGYRKTEEVLEWQNVSSFNNLDDVHKLYCGGLSLDKEKRNVFVTGNLADIKSEFQQLVTYCANDTMATYRVLSALAPEFFSRFPHPVTFAGMLEMGTAFLPINQNWNRYTRDSEDTYEELERELTVSLKREADAACHLLKDDAYREDPWLWDLDWSVQQVKIKKSTPAKVQPEEQSRKIQNETCQDEDPCFDPSLEDKFRPLMETRNHLYKKSPSMPGYPAWYRSLCNKDDQNGLLGPSDITTSAQVVPKLLKLTWDGYPLHHSRDLGWGYLVPGRPLEHCSHQSGQFPLKTCLEMCPPRPSESTGSTLGVISMEEAFSKFRLMTTDTADPYGIAAMWQATRSGAEAQDRKGQKKIRVTADRPAWHQGIGPYDVGIAGCWFFRLPHKSGAENNVGNPLAKDYLNKMEDGTLKTASGSVAQHVLKLNRMIIYWRNARDRILSQMVVWLQRSQLPRFVTQSEYYNPGGQYGSILPQVITSGTLTRRAVESTWMTASNAYQDRLGSELKAMVQCPPGLCLVGADVDSQELWIASVIGDAHFAGHHGCTALGWMTLQGKKKDGTDMHSRTAAAASITRDQAKVMNYGRIYGAGERFARTLLMQFNHRLGEVEATQRARQMYAMTKGTTVYRLNSKGRRLVEMITGTETDDCCTISAEELSSLKKAAKKNPQLAHVSKMSIEDLVDRKLWSGGTESDMFNKLEEIAQCDSPQTPVLRCRISRALEPRNVGKEFMTSRVNWVVQSSAVDYLHLMLVAMRYLFDTYRIDGRFCISIHDEVRYLVRTEDRYRAALALQITNLWTRSMFAFMLNMGSLPQSVAFFSAVDIDTVLRKEVNMDCQTPSNPYGLQQGYGIPFGQSLDIHQILEATRGGSLDP